MTLASFGGICFVKKEKGKARDGIKSDMKVSVIKVERTKLLQGRFTVHDLK